MRYSKQVLCFLMVTWLVLLGHDQVAWGQTGGSYTIDWWTIDSGGGASSGGQFTLSDTVGQSDASNFSSTDNQRYVLTDGFWQANSTQCVELRQLTIVGPESGQVLDTYHFSLQAGPAQASIPIAYQWSPEPISGQGTPNATYSWNTIAAQTISALAANCNDAGTATDTHVINIIGRTIAGRVTDGRNPLGGITVQTGQGQTAVTDRNGYYKITGLLSGTYSFAPVRPGFTFSPTSRTVTVPPDSRGQDFIVPVDIALTDIEVTQGIQNLANDIPLVAEKTTYVRVYGRATPITTKINALLYGSRNGVNLPGSPLRAIKGDIVLNGQNSAENRNHLESGWLFSLPYFWTHPGSIQLRVVLDPQQVYKEPNTGNNSRTLTSNFQRKSPVCIVTVRVRTHAPTASDNDPSLDAMAKMLKLLYPINDVQFFHMGSDIAEYEFPWNFGAYELPDDDNKVLNALATRSYLTNDPNECDDAGAYTHYVGIIHANTWMIDGFSPNGQPRYRYGLAWLNSDVAYVKLIPSNILTQIDQTQEQRFATLAHELGHNYGREHVNCGGPDGPDPNYPYVDSDGTSCKIDNRQLAAASTYYGFNIPMQSVIAPDKYADYMGYRGRFWTSDYTYRALLNRIGNGSNTATAAALSSVEDLQAAESIVYISGEVTPGSTTGTIEYGWVFPTKMLNTRLVRKLQRLASAQVTSVASTEAGNYHVRLLDSSGNVLNDRVVMLQVTADGVRDAAQGFNLAFPAPQNGNVARIELLDGNNVLAALQPGMNAPSLTILAPAGGEQFDKAMTLSWQATDPDSDDKLLFTVQYSPDNGQTWLALLTNFPNLTGSDITTVELDRVSNLPGSTTGGLIRVAASDGYHTTIATSQVFHVSNRVPKPYITQPTSSQWYAPEQSVPFSGGAYDPESGSVTESNLLWQVDNMPVGVGRDFNISGFAPGTHQVTLTVSDTVDQQSVITSSFTVEPLSIPLDETPALDGLCDDPAYSNGVTLPLAPYLDFTQASVSLVRTTDHLWVCFDEVKKSGGVNSSVATVWVDPNHSRDDIGQANDYGFLLDETGALLFTTGHSETGIVLPETSESKGVVNLKDTTWSGELQIHIASIIGANHQIGLRLAHFTGNEEGGEYAWPYTAKWGQPDTWATSVLGLLPRVEGLNPSTTVISNSGLQITVVGANFMNGAKVLWDNTPLSTTFSNSTLLTATVPASYLEAPREVNVKVQNPGGFESNISKFIVLNKAPSITNLTPSFIVAGGTTFTLTIQGTNFTNGSAAFWNGVQLPTNFVNASELKVEISASLIATGQTVGVTVITAEPDSQTANLVTFTIEAQGTTKLFLPIISR